MKIKRFSAPDMRQAIRQVRETFGPDAVILSNKAVDDGVELVAAMDYDESAVLAQSGPSDSAVRPEENPWSAPRLEPAAVPDQADRGWDGPAQLPGQVRSLEERLRARRAEQQAAQRPPVEQRSVPAGEGRDSMITEMRREMRELRRMMENELSELAWRDLGQRRPQTRELLRRLMNLDLAPELCRELAAQVDQPEDADRAYRQALTNLAGRLPVSGIDYLEQGGAVALIGPTGVGKTTTVAKLAARFCLRYGNRQLALITTDNYRIGAEEQLHTYGRILDVPVRTAADEESLNAALNMFSDRQLVLIDTAGMSQRDVRLSQQLGLLRRGNRPIHCLLTLAATTQAAALEHAVEAFAPARPSACVVTKVDEACALGGLITSLIRHRLPMAFSTDGQKVPEDIHMGRPHTLVSRAVELARRGGADIGEEFLAMKLGGAREHAHV